MDRFNDSMKASAFETSHEAFKFVQDAYSDLPSAQKDSRGQISIASNKDVASMLGDFAVADDLSLKHAFEEAVKSKEAADDRMSGIALLQTLFGAPLLGTHIGLPIGSMYNDASDEFAASPGAPADALTEDHSRLVPAAQDSEVELSNSLLHPKRRFKLKP